jgi:hypothetical protein
MSFNEHVMKRFASNEPECLLQICLCKEIVVAVFQTRRKGVVHDAESLHYRETKQNYNPGMALSG